MPSFLASPLILTVSGGTPEFEPRLSSFAPAALTLAFPAVSVGPGYPIFTTVVTAPKLDRIQRMVRYVNNDGTATPKLALDWQNTMEAIEAALGGLTGQVGDLTVLVKQIQAAQQLAQAANDVAQQNKAAQDIAASYTDPTSALTADSTGVITILAHTRVYGDGRSVPVNGGSLSGFASGDYVSVFYDDAARAGGAVAYQGSTQAIAQGGDRHSVGQIVIPQAGQSPSEGGGVSPPGYTPRSRNEEERPV